MTGVWKLPDLWTHRTRPQGPWKTADRFPQLPHALTIDSVSDLLALLGVSDVLARENYGALL